MNTQEKDFKGFRLSGFLMILIQIIIIAAMIFVANNFENNEGLVIVSELVLFTLLFFSLIGFVMIEPNEARVMMFFGKYKGTLKQNGFFWVNPFFMKKKLVIRARNLDIEPIKVNDKKGNPVMIGLILVWRIKDTYKVMFDIDNKTDAQSKMNERMNSYQQFVAIQSDAALRNIAGQFAYDNNEIDDDVTLRSSGEEVNDKLEIELNKRLFLAGIEVVEARINYLAYAPEIAAVMLRRQQASAIIAAREKIVEGAVSMVKMALDKLSEESIVELDDDKKAAMVSNLLVVLCADEQAKPVVNTGTLYQ
ncbi:MAG: SPFH domain-containing protein [Bacteroidales bacterium]|jgi:regulator of protease activity HflC (stomatin/prohibitin superfamily)|nr:SPFH domain-containing protein [Bacteroidales bacterium]MDD4001466.1 SPFH domain-containing protein [Bacteroidales bacterium]MDD4529170.1 SPFH domain-containing protein [Bacteroidales bacterium]